MERKRALKTVHLVEKKMKRTMPLIIFTNEDFKVLDLMVIAAEIINYGIRKVPIYQGNLINVLYWKTFLKIDIFKDLIIPYSE